MLEAAPGEGWSLGLAGREQAEGQASICTPALTRSQVDCDIKSHLTLIYFWKGMAGTVLTCPGFQQAVVLESADTSESRHTPCHWGKHGGDCF